MTVDPQSVLAAPGPSARERLTWYATTARLAPSKHNTQPWRFVVRRHVLDVEADRSRSLPVTDPEGRELLLACGAAAHLAHVAAAAVGHRLEVRPWPAGPDGPVARLRETGPWEPTDADRALLAAAAARRTDRGPLDADRLPASLPFDLQRTASTHGCTLRLVRSPGDLATLASALGLAERRLAQTPEAQEELHAWLRRPYERRRDGVPAAASRGPYATRAAALVQRDFSAPGVVPMHDRTGRDAPLVAVLCTPGDSRVDHVVAGQALMAVLLQTTVAGGSASYLNAALELPHTRALLRDDLALDGPAQVVLRLGVGGPVDATPRRDPGDVVAHADDEDSDAGS